MKGPLRCFCRLRTSCAVRQPIRPLGQAACSGRLQSACPALPLMARSDTQGGRLLPMRAGLGQPHLALQAPHQAHGGGQQAGSSSSRGQTHL